MLSERVSTGFKLHHPALSDPPPPPPPLTRPEEPAPSISEIAPGSGEL